MGPSSVWTRDPRVSNPGGRTDGRGLHGPTFLRFPQPEVQSCGVPGGTDRSTQYPVGEYVWGRSESKERSFYPYTSG